MLKSPIDRTGLAVAAAITAIGYFGGIRPVVAHQTQRLLMERSIASNETTLGTLRSAVAAKDAEVRALQGQVSEFRTTFEASPRINERIGEVAELAELAGVSVGSIRPGEPVESEEVRQQPISIGGQGDPGDIARFLSQLRITFPDMGMVSFSMSAGSAGLSSIDAQLVWFTGSADDDSSAGGSAE